MQENLLFYQCGLWYSLDRRVYDNRMSISVLQVLSCERGAFTGNVSLHLLEFKMQVGDGLEMHWI